MALLNANRTASKTPHKHNLALAFSQLRMSLHYRLLTDCHLTYWQHYEPLVWSKRHDQLAARVVQGGHPGDGYEEVPRRRREEEEEQQSEYTRRYSVTSPTVGTACCRVAQSDTSLKLPQGPRRGATPEEDLRRMSMREEDSYRSSRWEEYPPPHGRASYSGPPSAEPPYYRGQDARSPQVPLASTNHRASSH